MAFRRKESAVACQTKAYKFRVFPEHQKPDFDPELKAEIFAEARLMNGLWNRLVQMRRAALEEYKIIFNEERENLNIAAEEKTTAKALRQISPPFRERAAQLWKSYEERIKSAEAEPEIRASISWETRADVVNRFETSHKKAIKIGGEIRFIPDFIRQFHFPHRFTEGGLETGKLFGRKSKKLTLEAVETEVYADEKYRSRLRRVTGGIFGAGIGDRLQIPFRIVLHRQIPAAAKIKTAIFTGKLKNRRWEYHLVLTVDEPLARSESDFTVKNRVAGLDLGWRKFADYIRFGVLADSEGNSYEFRLPLDPGKKQSARRLEKMLARHGQAMKSCPRTWQDIEDWQTKNDHAAEQAKEKLRKLKLPVTEIIKPILDHLMTVRKSGLLRLLRALENLKSLEETIERTGDEEKGIEFLTAWRDRTFERESEIHYARERLINGRNLNYQLLVNWLKDNFDQIAYEGDLQLREMAKNAARVSLLEENGAMLKNSAKFRGRVALNELISRLKQKNGRDGDWLQARKSAFSTTTCLVCGAACEKTAHLQIVCENGHQADQDAQAATNLRNTLANLSPLAEKPLPIPERLKNIVVPLEL